MAGEGVSRYSFDPLERRGVLLGLDALQLVALVAGFSVAVAAVRGIPSPGGMCVAVVVAVGSAGSAFWTKDGRPGVLWLVTGTGWWLRHRRRRVLSPLPGLGERCGGREIRAGGLARAEPGIAEVTGIALLELPAVPGEPSVGVAVDSAARTWSAVIPVGGASLTLVDPDEQARRLDAWRLALNGIARPRTSIRRLQWVERTWVGETGGLVEAGASLAMTSAERADALDSYQDLVQRAAPLLQLHQVWLAVAIPGCSLRSEQSAARAAGVVRRELHLLEGQLRNSGFVAGRALDVAALAGVLESAHRTDPGASGRSTPRTAWALGDQEHWSAYRHGGTWHATYWIAEWPRVEVGPDFLSPLLFSGGCRTVSLTMAPVPPDRAAREARSARTADVADDQLRSRAGFISSARRDREAQGVARREEELADGHCEFRFSGYVTVTAPDRETLDAACAETEQAAQSSHLEIRRLYGRQREAFTWTLPLGRGLR